MNYTKGLRIVGLTLFFLVYITTLSTNTLLAQDCSEQTVQLTLPESWTLEPGDQFCFNVEVTNFDNIVLFFFVVNFNSTVLQLDSWDPTVSGLTGFTAGDVTPPTMRDPDVIRILWSHPNLNASSLPANSPLLELCFTVIGDPGNDGLILFNDTGLGSPAEFLNDVNVSFPPCNPEPNSGRVEIVPPPSTEPQIFVTGQCGSNSGADEGIVELKVFYGTPSYTIVSTVGNMVGTGDQDVFVFNDLPLGTHTFSVVDNNGLISEDLTIEITQDPAFTIDATTLKSPSCPTDFDGRIEVDITGGKPFANGDYFYDWGTAQIGLGQNELKDLSNGVYTVTVQDSLGCKQSADFELLRSPISVIENSITDAICDGRNNGIISVSAEGGGPFADGYIWNLERVEEDGSITPINNASDRGFNQEFRILAPGTYRITATDSVDRFMSCATMNEFVVGVQRELSTFFQPVDEENNTCTDGQVIAILGISTSSEPLTTPINIQLLDSLGNIVYDDVSSQDSIQIGCLDPGTYTSLISDPDGCTNTETLILQSNSITLEDSTLIDPSCNGEFNGSIIVEVSSNSLPIVYDWSNGLSGEGIDSIGGLPSGNYSLTVTDESGAQQTFMFTLEDPEALNVELLVDQDITCPGGVGNIIANVTGGDGNYTYVWLPDTTITNNSVLADLPAGDYGVLVIDLNGCFDQSTVSLTDKTPPLANLSNINPPVCLDDNTGTAVLTITPSPDYPGPFFFESSTGLRGSVNNFTVTNFPSGPDNFILFGDDACTFDTVFVDIPEAIPFAVDEMNTIISDIACFGDEGTSGATVNLAIDGPNDVDIIWGDDGSSGNVRVGLGAGDYPLELSIGDCIVLDTITILQPDSLVIAIDSINSLFALCGGDNNTQITLDVNGGTPDYSASWTDEGGQLISSTLSAENLSPGLYTIQVVDSNNCDSEIEVAVTEPEVVVATIASIVEPVCLNDQGFVTIGEVVGGIGEPYRYQVNTAPAIPTLDTGLIIPGDITIRVFDRNGCSWDTMIMVLPPTEITVSLGADQEIELGQSTSVRATIDSQSSIDSIIWTPAEIVECSLSNCSEVSVSPSSNVSLIAEVIDINGCSTFDEINIGVQRTSNIYIPNAFSPTATVPGNATFKVFGGSGIAAVDFIKVFDRYGNLVHSEEGSQPIPLSGVGNWNGYYNNDTSRELETGVYMYVVQFSFIDGGEPEIRSGNVTLIR